MVKPAKSEGRMKRERRVQDEKGRFPRLKPFGREKTDRFD
jgi:hypothetical protein